MKNKTKTGTQTMTEGQGRTRRIQGPGTRTLRVSGDRRIEDSGKILNMQDGDLYPMDLVIKWEDGLIPGSGVDIYPADGLVLFLMFEEFLERSSPNNCLPGP